MKLSGSETHKTTTNDNNIYDIICYYNEGEDEPQHVNEVISKIETCSRRRMSDRWIKWKLFGCLVINVLLSAPIYSYGTIYLQQKEAFDGQPVLIWPPIIFNSVYLFVTPWLFNTISTPASRHSRGPPAESSILSKLTNKSVIIVFTLILCFGISLGGVAFAWLQANIFVILIFYSIIGGMSSCIIMGKLFVLINGILNNDRMHMINFIYSFGQAMAQFLFPYLIHLLTRWVCYNCTLLVIGATMLHIIPITMVIVKNQILIELRPKEMTVKSPVDANLKEESRYSDISAISFDFFVDIKYPSDVFDMENKWKNPSSFKDAEASGSDLKEDHFLEDLDSQRMMNAEGVEILQTIPEADEETEVKLPDKTTAEDNGLTDDAVESIYEEINRKHEKMQDERKLNQFEYAQRFTTNACHNFCTTIYRQILNPLRRSLKIFKFYPSVILKSCDIFSYLLFITLILPNLALKQYQFDNRDNVIYLITLMGLCWIVYALLVLRFHSRLKQSFIHYFHIVGLLGKFFGYLFTNQRYSMNGFVFGLILISLGHANSFHLQEIMIRNCFHPRKWFYVRGSIYSFSGFLILVYSIVFHFLYVYLTFVTFCNIFVLFNLSGILVWLLTHYKSIIYICSRY